MKDSGDVTAKLEMTVRASAVLKLLQDQEIDGNNKDIVTDNPSDDWNKTQRAVEVEGYLLPDGITVIANMHHIHHNEDFYPDADKFVLDRILNDLRRVYATGNEPIEGHEFVSVHIWRCKIIEPQCPDIDKIAFAAVILPDLNPVVHVVKRENH
ncbi:hypothetical protein BDC45DRAFT_563112 [Circinella umbellata]|nr:hypothetical protein BDC45DRAFT_563112 [Circinella umbellata]